MIDWRSGTTLLWQIFLAPLPHRYVFWKSEPCIVSENLAVPESSLQRACAGAHLAELPRKLQLTGDDYLVVQQSYAGWWLFGVLATRTVFASELDATTHAMGGSHAVSALLALTAVVALIAATLLESSS